MASENNLGDESSRNRNERVNRPACAACKHQRKKCIQGKCALWSLFPGAESKEFSDVHRIFGISNVTKLILGIDSGEGRAKAARALKYQAMLWTQYPIEGPSAVILKLTEEVEMLKEEKNRQMNSNQFHQESLLHPQHLPVPVHPHIMFQNNMHLANNFPMGFQNAGLQRRGIMETQQIQPPHGLQIPSSLTGREGYNMNTSNVGLSGHNVNNNVGTYDSASTAAMEPRGSGSPSEFTWY